MRSLIILSFFIFFEIFANKITVSSYQLNSVYNYQYESSVEIQSSTISDLSEAAHTNPIAKLKFSVQPIEFSGSNILFAKLKVISSIFKLLLFLIDLIYSMNFIRLLLLIQIWSI